MMVKTYGSRLMLTVAIVAMVLGGCNNNPPPPYSQPTVIVRSNPGIAQAAPAGPAQAVPTSNLSTASFNVGAVTEVLKANQVTDGPSLEKFVNDPNNAINNVDSDGDGQTDFVSVQETGTGNTRQYEFLAYPSSQNGQNPVSVASVTLIVNGPNVTVNAGYPQYVNGWQSAYYSDTWAYRNTAFLAWMLLARPVYYHPYSFYRSSYGWYGWGVPHPIMAPQVMTTRRTTYYQTHTTVAPVRTTRPPATYTGVAATKVPPAIVRQPPPLTNNLGDRRGTVRSFQVDTRAKPTVGGAPPPPVRAAPVAPVRPSYVPPPVRTAPVAPPPASRPNYAPPPPRASAPPPVRPSYSPPPRRGR